MNDISYMILFVCPTMSFDLPFLFVKSWALVMLITWNQCQATAAWLGILWTKNLVGTEAGEDHEIPKNHWENVYIYIYIETSSKMNLWKWTSKKQRWGMKIIEMNIKPSYHPLIFGFLDHLSFHRWLLQASVLPNTFASWMFFVRLWDMKASCFQVTFICLIYSDIVHRLCLSLSLLWGMIQFEKNMYDMCIYIYTRFKQLQTTN